MMKHLVLCLLAISGCAVVPDFDDPRQAPLDEDTSVSCNNMLTNGTFDGALIVWTIHPGEVLIDERTLPSGHPYHAWSGDYFVWLGGRMSAMQSVSQPIAVPRTNTLRLDGWYALEAERVTGVEDTFKIEIVDEANTVLATAKTFTNVDAAQSTGLLWNPLHIEFPSSAFADRTVTFRIASSTDAINNTNFLFDSLELTPGSCY